MESGSEGAVCGQAGKHQASLLSAGYRNEKFV